MELALQPLVEDPFRLRGVVVGEHDQGAWRVGIAELATTLTVVLRRRSSRRTTRGPFSASSSTPAAEGKPNSIPASRRPKAPTGAEHAKHTERNNGRSKRTQLASSSTATSPYPDRAQPLGDPPAASRSPAEHGVVSIGAKCSHTSRNVRPR